MAIRMRLAEPEYARTVAEQAVADGVITSNADNATILYVPNGLYKTSVEWGDSRACADIESYMTGYNDPRLTQYFSTPPHRATAPSSVAALERRSVTSLWPMPSIPLPR